MNPAYKIPSHEIFGTTILDEVYLDTKQVLKSEVERRKVTIMQDDWSTNQNDPIICHSLTNGTNSYFLDGTASKTTRKDTDYCLDLLQKSIHNVETEFEGSVIACVTDNGNEEQIIANQPRNFGLRM